MQENELVAQLVVLAPDSLRGRKIALSGDQMIVGREPACQVRLDDPHVSRAHAALRRHGQALYVQDLGSLGGTLVNGTPANPAHELRSGDVITFASVRTRFQAIPPGEQTASLPVQPAFAIGSQHGEAVSNVAGDQYNSPIQQVIQQRDSFLREIAATKTKARWLAWTGFVVLIAGYSVFGYGFYQGVRLTSGPNIASPAQANAGVPALLIGLALAAIGMVALILGIILHIVAAARRRRIERELPIPQPWPDTNLDARRT